MNDGHSPASPESTAARERRTGLIESAVQKLLFSRQVRVDSIEEFGPRFRLIALRGDALKGAAWAAGDKVQIQLGGWALRTYTPLEWDPVGGCTGILAYLRADGPGTRWARSLRVGDACGLFGPRRSIDLARLRRPAVFFGDETTFGLARALRATAAGADGVEFLFEVSDPSESLQVLEHLGLTGAHLCTRGDGESRWPELETRVLGLLDSRRPAQFVLSGRSTSIQGLRHLLGRRGCAASQFHTRAYWAPGKKGLS